MSELKILTLHIEDDKYAYYHVENIDTKVILVHDVSTEDIKTLVRSLEAKAERQCKFLIIVDKDKQTPFDNLLQIEKLIERSISPQSIPFKIEPLPEMTMPFIADYRPKNPHQNIKSRNCRLRRK